MTEEARRVADQFTLWIRESSAGRQKHRTFAGSRGGLRITSVFPCVARELEARPSFRFTGCCWWRSLAVDGGSGTSRGHVWSTLGTRRSPGKVRLASSGGGLEKGSNPRAAIKSRTLRTSRLPCLRAGSWLRDARRLVWLGLVRSKERRASADQSRTNRALRAAYVR